MPDRIPSRRSGARRGRASVPSREESAAVRGAVLVEFALVLPILIVMMLCLLDYGRLIQANLIVANVSREGGSLVSRGINSGERFLDSLQASASPIDIDRLGKIYVHRIVAGTSVADPYPRIDSSQSYSRGSLAVDSSIGGGTPLLGLTAPLYDHLRFTGEPNNTADISELWIVEVYYLYEPVSPFISPTPGYGGSVLGSKSIF